ncbi:hypothetical protein C0J52_25433 [Blattella germanica]|nr:hypothetical protein C0J52_25433 [Blattella germanica]
MINLFTIPQQFTCNNFINHVLTFNQPPDVTPLRLCHLRDRRSFHRLLRLRRRLSGEKYPKLRCPSSIQMHSISPKGSVGYPGIRVHELDSYAVSHPIECLVDASNSPPVHVPTPNDAVHNDVHIWISLLRRCFQIPPDVTPLRLCHLRDRRSFHRLLRLRRRLSGEKYPKLRCPSSIQMHSISPKGSVGYPGIRVHELDSYAVSHPIECLVDASNSPPVHVPTPNDAVHNDVHIWISLLRRCFQIVHSPIMWSSCLLMSLVPS